MQKRYNIPIKYLAIIFNGKGEYTDHITELSKKEQWQTSYGVQEKEYEEMMSEMDLIEIFSTERDVVWCRDLQQEGKKGITESHDRLLCKMDILRLDFCREIKIFNDKKTGFRKVKSGCFSSKEENLHNINRTVFPDVLSILFHLKAYL